MIRISTLVGLAVLGLAFMVGTGVSQDTKKDPAKTKSYLPTGWKELGLTKAQVSDVGKIHENYKSKIKALEDQIKEVKFQEKQEMVKLLTDGQKEKLRKLALGEESGNKAEKDKADK